MGKYWLPAVLLFTAAAAAAILIDKVWPPSPQPAPFRPSPSFRQSAGPAPDIPFSLPPGFTVRVFAGDLGNPRDLAFSPGGTLLVSDPADGLVYALPDPGHTGEARGKAVITGQYHPHGLAFYGRYLYVAEPDKVIRYVWDEAKLTATQEQTLFTLPDNRDHNNRSIAFDPSGNMYVSVGATCNVCIESSPLSGTVIMSDAAGTNPTVFATGLRNAAFIAVNPATGELWGTEMGRDYLGDNLPPDEIDIIRQGDYGWPFCYGNKEHDDAFDPQKRHSCGQTVPPVYEIPAHSAPLGLAFIHSPQFPTAWQGDLLVAYHGSWNRTKPVGYRIVRLTVRGNAITGSADFMTGFLPTGAGSGSDASGRPVDLVFDNRGNLYVSDDKAGAVYIIQQNP